MKRSTAAPSMTVEHHRTARPGQCLTFHADGATVSVYRSAARMKELSPQHDSRPARLVDSIRISTGSVSAKQAQRLALALQAASMACYLEWTEPSLRNIAMTFDCGRITDRR